LHLVNTKV